MIDHIKIAEEKMKKAIEVLKKNYAAIRTGRAHPSLLDHVLVEYYGSQVPLKQLAGIGVPEPKTITITPYDKESIKDIEKAILKSDLGLTPKTEASLIRLILPPLTEERRKELVKVIKKEAEDAKISIRNIRREAMEALKGEKEKGSLSEDQERVKENEAQRLTTKFTEEADKILGAKEAEIMEV